MLRWFRIAHPPRRPVSRSTRFSVELLEDRNSPSAIGDPGFFNPDLSSLDSTTTNSSAYSVATPPDGTAVILPLIYDTPLDPLPGTLSEESGEESGEPLMGKDYLPPAIEASLSLEIAYGEGNEITLTGVLTDDQPGGRIISLSGVIEQEVTTDPYGGFSITLNATTLGSIQALTTASNGNLVLAPSVSVESNCPFIEEFVCGEDLGSPGWFIFAGRVIDESPGGLTVHFGGSPVSLGGKSAVTESDGWFSLRVQLNGTATDNGTGEAVVTDWWGLQSDVATCDVSQPGIG